MNVTALRCEYVSHPLGIDARRPRLSWQLDALRRGARQTAYQILTATSEESLRSEQDLLWDSGKIFSDQSIHIAYAGPELVSRQRVYWRVRVWDEVGQQVPDSEVEWWEMGLLQEEDWQADWIGRDRFSPPLKHSPSWPGGTDEEVIKIWQDLQTQVIERLKPPLFVRTTFAAERQVAQARLYGTARGLYYAYLNGQRVGEDYLRPGWTDYHKRLQYQTYDVTGLIQAGDNVLGAILGDGWYAGVIGGAGESNYYGQDTQVLLQLEITYSDGSRSCICTGQNWRMSTGPFLYADLYMGERYDARLELTGWSQAHYDASHWQPVVADPRNEVPLVAQCGPTVQKVAELQPLSLTEPAPKTFVFDLGQNMVGWVRLRVSGLAGTTVQLRFAEMLNPDGTVYITNLRSAKATDYYTLRGDGEEVYEPAFTFHGFRYVELTGYSEQPDLNMVMGIVLQSATPPTGSFSSSSALVNQLVRNIEWGQRGNFLDVPTDCPQRDERLGWTGDAQIFVRTATYNAEVAGFFTKWLRDVGDSQGAQGYIPNIIPAAFDANPGSPAWADACIIVPWTIARVYGDQRLLAENYAVMTRWIDYLDQDNPDHRWHKHRNGNGEGQWDFGDWLSINADTPKDVLADAFYAYSVSLLASIAQTLGKEQDALRYQRLHEQIKEAFNRNYVAADGRITGDTQTVYVLALSFGLLPDNLRALAAQHLVDDIRKQDNHLSTGFLGVGHLLPALTGSGYTDVAYQLLLQETFPSWGYSIKHGATTIWERWDGWTADKGFQSIHMNSFNHYSLGSVGDWLYRYAAGIDTDTDPTGQQTGYKHILLRPYPDPALSYVHADYDSIYGRISSHWSYTDDKQFAWQITIPANTSATVFLPADHNSRVTESGLPVEQAEGVAFVRQADDRLVYHIQSGSYLFQVA